MPRLMGLSKFKKFCVKRFLALDVRPKLGNPEHIIIALQRFAALH